MAKYRRVKLGSLRSTLAFQAVTRTGKDTSVTTGKFDKVPAGALFGIGRRIADLAGIVHANFRCLLILALDRFVHFAAMDGNFPRRLDAQANFVAAHVDDGYHDVIANDDALIALSGKH